MSRKVVAGRPLFSVLTPVFNPRLDDIHACAQSVLKQTLADWEWILADDASSDDAVVGFLSDLATDPKVTVLTLAQNVGISAATNAALERAKGEFIVFLDHDDELTIDALDVVASAIDTGDRPDMLYSDEVKIGENGGLYDWFAKPEWSPERLRGHNYCNHLTVVRTDLVRELGGLRSELDGAQDHDLVLRIGERSKRVVHVPRVLYRWRAAAGSTASDAMAKPEASVAGCRAVQEHLQRSGIDADVIAPYPGRYRMLRRLQRHPSVSIVIPTRGDTKRVGGRPVDLVLNAVESITSTCEYPGVQFVVVHDRNTPHHIVKRLIDVAGPSLVLVEWDEPFHFSRQVNLGAVRANGEVLVLLNDDTQVITPDWLETLVGFLEEPDVGMVGPMLLLADGRIQSAGHHYSPTPLHVGAGAAADDPGPHAMFTIAGERSGVTAACAALRRDVFFEVGGLSVRFPNCYNDVDLGFKLIEAGYRIVWTPHAKLHHFESLTRDPRPSAQEAEELADRWGRWLGADRYTRQLDLWWAELPFFPPSDEGTVQ
jgi:GT2 family glycosyltransferase